MPADVFLALDSVDLTGACKGENFASVQIQTTRPMSLTFPAVEAGLSVAALAIDKSVLVFEELKRGEGAVVVEEGKDGEEQESNGRPL